MCKYVVSAACAMSRPIERPYGRHSGPSNWFLPCKLSEKLALLSLAASYPHPRSEARTCNSNDLMTKLEQQQPDQNHPRFAGQSYFFAAALAFAFPLLFAAAFGAFDSLLGAALGAARTWLGSEILRFRDLRYMCVAQIKVC